MRNDFIAHSYKGSSWKNHLYDRKEGKRYIYSKNIADTVVGNPTEEIQGMTMSFGKIKPVQIIRDLLNTKIWSPNKRDNDTLIKKGQAQIAKIFNKKKLAKKR